VNRLTRLKIYPEIDAKTMRSPTNNMGRKKETATRQRVNAKAKKIGRDVLKGSRTCRKFATSWNSNAVGH